jgi:anti-anti-sigma factor
MFKVSSIQYDPRTWILAVQGEVDSSTAPELEEALDGLFKQGTYRVILDFERVSFVSSAGFGILIHARDVVLKHGGGLVFAGTTARVREIFDLLGISSFLRFAPDLGGALAQIESETAAHKVPTTTSQTP